MSNISRALKDDLEKIDVTAFSSAKRVFIDGIPFGSTAVMTEGMAKILLPETKRCSYCQRRIDPQKSNCLGCGAPC